ncbi:MAG: transporter substrate-binding domain-containing protein [Paraglaciecola sp.]|nr:transporter substrate-binding domain-containing protein [Paraglaciecola sp.]
MLRFFLLLVLYAPLNASQAQDKTEPTGASMINIATGDGYFPFVDSSFMYGGWSKALLEAIFSEMAVKAHFEVLPWDRGLKWTQEAKLFGAFPYIKSPERSEHFLYSQPINFVPIRLYVAQDSRIDTIEKVRGKRLCIPHGYSIGAAEQSVIERFAMTVNRAKDGLGCVGQVQRGWSDAGLTNGYIKATKLHKTDGPYGPIKIFPEELSTEPLYFVMSKSYPHAQEWMNKFNVALEQLVAKGQKQQIDKVFIEALVGN